MAWEPDSGAIDRETFLRVLQRHKVVTSPDPDYPGHTLSTKRNKLDSRLLDDWIERDIIRYFARTFGIPMASFFNSPKLSEVSKKAAVNEKS
jgi:hypothetical protein